MKSPEQMTDEELRIEIAEFCGYEIAKFDAKNDDWAQSVNKTPNYPQSLDAMWEAEQVMIDHKAFGHRIFYTTYIDHFNADQHAIAKQRAIAFVKTIREIKK